MNKLKINRLEKDSILYFQGGGEDIVLSPERNSLREFYSVSNSYIVVNALLMPGISNEKARLKEEGKKVDLSMFDCMDELVEIYCRLYSAMCKYTYFYRHKDKYHTYRADRMNTLDYLGHGQMYSFMSTKKCNDRSENFHGKDGILLLEVEAEGNIEHVDVNAVLGEESKYPLEQEILFAPFVLLDREPLEMTEEEKLYKDIHDNPPEAKYMLYLRLSSIVPCKIEEKELRGLYQKITFSESIKTVRQIWEMLMGGKEPGADAVQCYIKWKEKLQTYLRMSFAKIKYEILSLSSGCEANDSLDIDQKKNKDDGQGIDDNLEADDMQRSMQNRLEKDMEEYYEYTDEKRKRYKRYVQIVNVSIAVLYPLTSLFVALSFFDNVQIFMKVFSLLSSTAGAIVPLVAKGFAWHGKLQQRTVVFMKLDKLRRDMRYEKEMDEAVLDRYVERFREIIDEDNTMGQNNVQVMADYLESVTNEAGNKKGMNNGKEK